MATKRTRKAAAPVKEFPAPRDGWDTRPTPGSVHVFVSPKLATMTLTLFPRGQEIKDRVLRVNDEVWFVVSLRMFAWATTRMKMMHVRLANNEATEAQYDEFCERWDELIKAVWESGMYSNEALAWAHDNEDEQADFKPPFAHFRKKMLSR